jgi:hypothetical protein
MRHSELSRSRRMRGQRESAVDEKVMAIWKASAAEGRLAEGRAASGTRRRTRSHSITWQTEEKREGGSSNADCESVAREDLRMNEGSRIRCT